MSRCISSYNDSAGDSQLLSATDVREFFQHRVVRSAQRQQVPISEDAIVYIVDLLTRFTRTDQFFEWQPDGMNLSPLALTLGDAVMAETAEQRRMSLQRLGDVALFVAGVFAESLNRQAVDVDYYIAMGENAYGTLGGAFEDSVRGRALSAIFGEMASRFARLVDVLSDLRASSQSTSDRDVLSAYEAYLRTGSRQAARCLREAGIMVSPAAGTTRH